MVAADRAFRRGKGELRRGGEEGETAIGRRRSVLHDGCDERRGSSYNLERGRGVSPLGVDGEEDATSAEGGMGV